MPRSLPGLVDTPDKKIFSSKTYNFIFDKRTGNFARWGRTLDDDPDYSPIGPEILDLEIVTGGCPDGGRCRWCYKDNTGAPGELLAYDDFVTIIDRVGPQLTQVAFGITGVQSHPDFIRMLRHCRSVGVVPNFTLTGRDLTPELAQEIVPLVGGLAVSCYDFDKHVCYNTVETFANLGLKQTNMHLFACAENEAFIHEVIGDRLTDPRLAGLNAIVFLGVKPKGRAKDRFTPLSSDSFKRLVSVCMTHGVSFGFDSCSAPKFDVAVSQMNISNEEKRLMQLTSESCESSLFSAYINVRGEYWNCSFSEDEPTVKPVSVLKSPDFLRDVWFSPEVVAFRERLLMTVTSGSRRCPVFPVINP